MKDGIEHITDIADKEMPSIQKSPVKVLNSFGGANMNRKKRSLDSAIAALYNGVHDVEPQVPMINNVKNPHMNSLEQDFIKTVEPKDYNGISNHEDTNEPLAAVNGTDHLGVQEGPLVVDETNGAEHNDLKPTMNGHPKMPCIWYSDLEKTEGDQQVPKVTSMADNIGMVSMPPENMVANSPTYPPEPLTPNQKTVEGIVPQVESPPKLPEAKLPEASHTPVMNGQLLNGNHQISAETNTQPKPLLPPNPLVPNPSNHTPPHPPMTLPDNVMTTNAMGEPEAVCPECRKVFKRKVYLQRHMEREHWSTAKVFRCEDCGYETKHQSNLSVHRRTHTGERPYHCGACGQRYTQGHLLKSHIRSRHNGNMIYYKLDKKGDGSRSRGRRSLCIEDQLPQMDMPPIKQPKIENILSAMAQGVNLGGHNNPNLGLFMNTTIGFMGSPFLQGPKMLPFSGSMQNGASQLLGANNFLAPPPSLPMLPPGFGLIANPGLRLGPQQPHLLGGTRSPEQTGPKIEEIPLPQDLSVKKGDENGHMMDSSDTDSEAKASPPINQPNTGSHMSQFPPPITDMRAPIVELPTEQAISPVTQAVKEERMLHPLMSPRFDKQRCDKLYFPNPRCDKVDCNKLQCDKSCNHSSMLQDLRKNVVRMLSILTPDLNIDNGIDYESDQVDRLLHEVIYSNVEDEIRK